MGRVAVVGAGIAGLTLARRLAGDHDVVVYEKSRGPGGRMATRYAADFEFDHGAQYFTARSDGFRRFLAPLIRDGLVAPWRARFAEIAGTGVTHRSRWGDDDPHYVGVPRMNVIGKALARGVDVRYETRVSGLERAEGGWQLDLVDASGTVRRALADWVLVCVPLPQATPLLVSEAGFLDAAGGRTMQGCHALMLGFDAPPDLSFDAAAVSGADIGWIARNSSKPGRSGASTIVVHATNAWSAANMELDAATVLEHLVGELSRVTGLPAAAAAHQAVHRWRYANAPHGGSRTHWLDTKARIGTAGDWWNRGRVESAFESAFALSEQLRAATR